MSHTRIWYIWAALTVAALLLVALETVAQESPGAPSEVFKPVAPHHALMEWHDQSYAELNKAIGKEKKSDAAANAWLLAELANVSATHSAEADYRQWATQLREQAKQMAELAEKKDFAAAKALSKKIDATCKACHDKYEKTWKED